MMTSLIDVGTPVQNGTSPVTTGIDLTNADRLRKYTNEAGAGRPRWSKFGWATSLAKARVEFGDSRFQTVFDWYVSRKRDRHSHQAFCGDSFNKKFLAIERAMIQNREDNPTVVVTAPAQAAARRLTRLGWPKGCESQLPCAIQICADRIYEFRCGVISWLNAAPVETASRLTDLAIYVDYQLSNSIQVAEDWMASAHGKANWDKFDGNLLVSWILWSPTHKNFTAQGKNWADHKTGRSELWDRLMKELPK